MNITEEHLVGAAAGMAQQRSNGFDPDPAVLLLLQAAAAQKSEAERHELAERARLRTEGLTEGALEFLRLTIFALGAL